MFKSYNKTEQALQWKCLIWISLSGTVLSRASIRYFSEVIIASMRQEMRAMTERRGTKIYGFVQVQWSSSSLIWLKSVLWWVINNRLETQTELNHATKNQQKNKQKYSTNTESGIWVKLFLPCTKEYSFARRDFWAKI